MKNQSDEIILCMSDLKRLFNKALPKIKKAGLIGASAAFLFILVKEPRFIAEATFKQASPVHEVGMQLRDLFQTGSANYGQETGVAALLASRVVLRDAVEELGLQVKWDRHFRITRLLGRIWENISLELGSPLADVDEFVFKKVKYDGEKAKVLFIKVLNDGSFKLLDENRVELGKWNLHEKISLPFFTGCLTKMPSFVGGNKIYRLNILPWTDVVASVRSRLTVKSLKEERRLFTLKFSDRNRYLAADFLNQAMKSCQKVIHNENEEIASAQLSYLKKRQEELALKWDDSLQEHVAYLKDNLNGGGYLSFAQEYDYLQEPQSNYSSRLLDIDFELTRLESQDAESEKNLKKTPRIHKDFSDIKKPLLQISTIKNGASVILEEQKKEIDERLLALELDEKHLQESGMIDSHPKLETAMEGEVVALSEQQEEASRLLELLENGKEVATGLDLLNDPKSIVAIWAKQIASQQKNYAQNSHDKNPLFSREKEQIKDYIEQTARKIKILQDNIALHASTAHEFEGLTLETAQRLYLDYNNQRDSLQAQLKQLVYLSEQLYQPQFELSSITTILSDPVTQGLVLQAGDTAVRLQDANNRSLREQDHLKETLHTQKSFISQHLLQVIELTKLRAKLTEDKIASLRKTTIGLLKQEKQLLQQQLDQISRKMEDLPEKWRRENVLLLKKELGMKMIEGLTHLMENKSIDRHLFQVGSKPFEYAIAPVNPKSPQLLKYALMGCILGAFGCYFFYLSRSLVKGMPVSHEMFLSSGLNSCGPLSTYCHATVDQISHTDLETLRRLSQFLLNLKQKGICCTIIGGKNPDFSSTLAQLLSMQQCRVLVVQYVFDKPVHPEDAPGLWQYLQGEVQSCPIRKQLSFDFVPSGGTTRHSVELLSNPKLSAFLTSAKSQYDVVLFYSSAEPADVEGQALLNIADAAIIAANAEKKEDFFLYDAWAAGKQKECVAFVDLS
ncbi:MAG: hypothetical protein JSR39_09845 [Verrucomicrobia bacterium]|nr:hypothetical protein [Verrucomicrobiota bacterium]